MDCWSTRMPPDRTDGNHSGFIPQIRTHLNQYTKELQLGDNRRIAPQRGEAHAPIFSAGISILPCSAHTTTCSPAGELQLIARELGRNTNNLQSIWPIINQASKELQVRSFYLRPRRLRPRHQVSCSHMTSDPNRPGATRTSWSPSPPVPTALSFGISAHQAHGPSPGFKTKFQLYTVPGQGHL